MIVADKFRAAGLSIILSWGWKRAAIALAAGALSALAMAPFNAWPVLFLTFPVMVWLVDGAGAGRMRGLPAAAMAGWWFGLGYFVPGLYWIGYAFLVDAPTFAWLLPFAILGLPAYLALFTAIGFALARLIWTSDASRVLALAVCLTLSEWLRGHVLTGFPWNAFGYALTEPLLRLVRNVLPPMGGVDLSPLLALIALQFAKMVILPPLQQLIVMLN